MRKTIVFLALVATLATAATSKAEGFGDKLILYVPNRVVDFADMFSLSLGLGPALKAQGWTTRFISLGASYGGTAKIIKDYNRQYGAGLQSGWSGSFLMVSAEDSEVFNATRGVQEYTYFREGVPNSDMAEYDIWEGPRDIWALGGEVAVLVEVDGAIHPFEIGDFAAGLVFVDPKGDDYSMDDLSNSAPRK